MSVASMATSTRGRIVCMLDTLVKKTPPCIKDKSLCKVISENLTFVRETSIYNLCLNSQMKIGIVMSPWYVCGRPQASLSSHHQNPNLHRPSYQHQLDNTSQDEIDSVIKVDLRSLFSDINKELAPTNELLHISKYHFGGKGKNVRPIIVSLMSQTINIHLHNDYKVLNSQRQVAKIAEMIHTASLYHDDVIDSGDTRRGNPTVNSIFGQRNAVLAGDYVLSVALAMLSQINNKEVFSTMTQIMADLVQGEFMQLMTTESEDEIFTHYLEKSFNKNSVFAYSCKAVAILSGGDESIQDIAFQYGYNLAIAYQLVDDIQDFLSIPDELGKPTAKDLKHGLATAPVLFACEKFPELKAFIMRRFQNPGDVTKAFELVHKSDGVEQAQKLVEKYCDKAIKFIISLKPSPEQNALITMVNKINKSKDKVI